MVLALSGLGGLSAVVRSTPTPALVPDLAFWYDAAKGITLNGSDVSAWADQSGAANHVAQATAALQPVYTASNPHFRGRPSVDFHKAAGEYLFGADLPVCTAMSGSDKPLTVFVVCRRSTKISADEHAFTLGNSGQATQSYLSGGWRYQNSNSQRVNGDVRDDAGTAATNSTGLNETTDLGPQVLIWQFTGTGIETYVVGNSQNPRYDATVNATTSGGDYSSQGAITFDRFSIGAQLRASTASKPAEMEVAAIVGYTRDLTDAERNRVAMYLWREYCDSNVTTVLPDSILDSLIHSWDAAGVSALAGETIASITDGAGGKTFSSPLSTNRPTCRVDATSGKKYAEFDGVDNYMTAGVAADWQFLHDGTDYTLALVYRPKAAASALTPMVDTVDNDTSATGHSGIGIYHDAASAAHSIQVKIGATNATAVLNHDSQDGGSRPDAWHVLILTREGSVPSSEENYTLTLDNELYVVADQGVAPNAVAPDFALTLGALAGAGTFGQFDFQALLVFDRKLGRPGALQNLAEVLARNYATDHTAIVAGNGLAGVLNDAVNLHRGFPGVLYTQAGRFLCTYRRGPDHGNSAGVACIATSADGYRWSGERVIVDDSANYDWRGTNFLGQISTGRIFLGGKLSQTDSTLLPFTAHVLYSDDDGETWQGPVFLSNAGDSWFRGIASGTLDYDEGINSVVELGDGTLLAHFMALVDGAVYPHILQCRSMDGGATWTQPEPIYYGRQPGLGNFPQDERCQEPVCIRFADGELLLAIRADTPNERIYFARSTDADGFHDGVYRRLGQPAHGAGPGRTGRRLAFPSLRNVAELRGVAVFRGPRRDLDRSAANQQFAGDHDA
ncbi:MAG: hypothetical protein DCC68_21240 [Planctomycetota bacterium]|nr:MAG: hypothetical protein DCC68_21240 [Planctomycetota bacterium]